MKQKEPAFNRNTDDLDMWLEDTAENRNCLRIAFIQLDYGDFESLETLPLLPPGVVDLFIGDGIHLDILGEMKGLEGLPFEECLQLSSNAELEGVNILFCI